MLTVLNRYRSRDTLLKIIADLGLLTFVLFVLDISIPRTDSFPLAATHGISLAGAVFLSNSTSGLYSSAGRDSTLRSLLCSAWALSIGLGFTYAVLQAFPVKSPNQYPIQMLVMSGVAGIIAHRIYASHFGGVYKPRTRVMILGGGPAAEMAGEALLSSRASVVGYFLGFNEEASHLLKGKLLSGHGSLWQCAKELHVDEVIVALTERRGGSMPLPELLECKIHGIKISDISSHFERVQGKIKLEHVKAGWLIFGEGFNNRVYHSIIKHLFDIASTLFLLVLTAPLMILTSILILLDSKGPVFYRQERVGQDGKPYHVLKFRSMRTDAERDGVARWATANDDRVTRVGRVIRRFRIDELPQLLNVLTGKMSLVGPRPERPVFVQELSKQIPYYEVRHSLKPGITGWAQIKYQYGSTLADSIEKLEYDLYYVKNHTLLLDLRILLQTVGVVLTGKGAR